jgi:hypothetical protein
VTPEEIGLNARLIVAGAAGGLVNSITFWSGWKSALAAIVTGTLVANYLGPALSKLIEMPEPVAGFICGMAALVLTNGVISAVQARFHVKDAD